MATWRTFGIRRGDRVLDAGCGLFPYAFATHLADVTAMPEWDGRPQRIPTEGRPFYRCSVERLPFASQSFDFVHCSHVLEHVRNPARACTELMRVARRGYIECPRSWTEHLFSAADHRWLVDWEESRLVFRRKLPEEYGDVMGVQYRIFDWLEHRPFRVYWNLPSVSRVRNVELYWEGSFAYAVVAKRSLGPIIAARREQ
jgi:SAM-dependent methyltransferase